MTSQQGSATGVLQVGDQAPRFTLDAYPAGPVTLDDFIGKKNVILAFYPKDDTPGCTTQMCNFSGDLSRFDAAGTQVLGISCDHLESHEKFARKFSLNVPLLADVDGTVGKLYGTVREGKPFANRVLFVIDKKGVIKHIEEGIPDNQKLIEILEQLD